MRPTTFIAVLGLSFLAAGCPVTDGVGDCTSNDDCLADTGFVCAVETGECLRGCSDFTAANSDCLLAQECVCLQATCGPGDFGVCRLAGTGAPGSGGDPDAGDGD